MNQQSERHNFFFFFYSIICLVSWSVGYIISLNSSSKRIRIRKEKEGNEVKSKVDCYYHFHRVTSHYRCCLHRRPSFRKCW